MGEAGSFTTLTLINFDADTSGLEIACEYEDRQKINGIQVADARTGEMI